MKSFFANKINYLIILALVLTLGAAGFLGYNLLNSVKEVTVPDFLGKKKEEVFEWCGQLDDRYSCEIVYEGSRSVEKDIVFQQSLNAGSKLTDKITIRISSELISPIELPQLYEAQRSSIEDWANKNGIENISFVEEFSDTVSKGIVIRMEPMESIYSDTPVTVYISKGKENAANEPIEVKYGEYVNLSVAAFESQVKGLGLVPNHNTFKDASSTTVSKGNIVWHGSGTYTYGETINYGVCTDESKSSADIVVKAGSYVGYTEENFKKKATELGLEAKHNTSRDAYSDSIAKGSIVWHGSGTYVKNETFNYGLSLGKEGSSTPATVYVSAGTYVGKTVEEFQKAAVALGLIPTHKTSLDEYSDTIAKGNIVWHGSGTYNTNDSSDPSNYGVSLGKSDGSSGSATDDEIVITNGAYVGYTEENFKKKATELGLKATHIDSRDAYSDTI
ncbi:MAG: hypothetical protein IKQ98_08835, partial [Erysipelotrichaceae bacterium]|nr:hypothetical protein [Erysipelotrichaceae bacterium]